MWLRGNEPDWCPRGCGFDPWPRSVKGLSIAMNCGVGRRHSSDPVLPWLWHRPAATALIRPLAWEPPYAVGAALEKAKRQKKKKKVEMIYFTYPNNPFHSIQFSRIFVAF